MAVSEQNQKSVLVVEDDRSHRTMMDQILKSCDFKTEHAENGIIALSKLNSGHHYDLVLLDWDMPELNGLDTVRAIRSREVQEKLSHIPVIAFTAKRDPGDREACLAAGMDAYLPKDVWMPHWRQTLVDNLQGLFAGDFDFLDFEKQAVNTDIMESKEDFDLDMFNQTADLLKDELEIAIEEYLEDAMAYIRDIERGLKEKNPKQAAQGSHPLKSNSKGFGLLAVTRIAEQINNVCENASLEEAMKTTGKLLPELHDALQSGEERLRLELRQHPF